VIVMIVLENSYSSIAAIFQVMLVIAVEP